MSNVKRYNIEFIFNFKNKIILNEKNREILNNLSNAMGCDPKIKIKTPKDILLNNSKWCRKIFLTIEEKKSKQINSYLNMCSKSNYKRISNDIFRIKIKSANELDYLINLLIQKYRYDYTFDIWNDFIRNLIFKNVNKWKFDNKYPVERLLDKVNEKLNEIIDSNYQHDLENYFSNNIELFYKTKKINNGLMKLISYLFSFNLLSKSVITDILKKLTLNINRYYKLELGIVLIKYIFEYVNESEKEKFLEYFDLFLKDTKLNKKIKFMILDFFDEKKINNDVEEDYDSDIVEVSIKSSLDEYLEDNDTMNFLNNFVNVKYNLNKLVYFITLYLVENNNKFNKVYPIFIELITNRIIKTNILKYGLIDFLQDYDEYKYDNFNINLTINKILNNLIKDKHLTEDNVNFMLSKIKSEVKESIKFKLQ